MSDQAQPELYGQAHFAPRPTAFTLFLRTSLLWQLARFLVVNLRMTAMILKSHDSRVTKRLPPSA